MTDTLFDLPGSPSPRLEWMRRHNIDERRCPGIDDGDCPYEAWIGCHETAVQNQCEMIGNYDGPYYVAANSPDEAITQLAIANNLKLWNEE